MSVKRVLPNNYPTFFASVCLFLLCAGTPLYAFNLNTVNVTGVTLPFQSKIDRELQVFKGRKLNSDLLNDIRTAVFNVFSEAGYFARVTFPAQDLTNGEVQVNVTELTLGEVNVISDDDVRLGKDKAAGYVTAVIASDLPLSINDLDRQVLVLDGLNGIAAETSLSFDEKSPKVDINLQIKTTEAVEYSSQVDSFGGESTGRARFSFDAQFNSPFYLGDRLVVSAVKSESLATGSVDLEVPAGFRGQRVVLGARKTMFDVTSDTDKINGTSVQKWARFRSAEQAIFALPVTFEAGFERSRNIDSVDGADALTTDKSMSELYVSASLALVNNSSTAAANISIRLTFGDLDLGRLPTVEQQDASTVNAQGAYQKLAINATGQRKLSPQNSLTVTSACQFSSKNLDSGSELEISGPSAVRAYDVAAVSVDQGCFAQVEFVHQQSDQSSYFGFVDGGYGRTHHSTFDGWQLASEANEFAIFGVGLGTRLNIADNFNFSMTYARRLGACVGCSSPQAQDRLWAAFTATF